MSYGTDTWCGTELIAGRAARGRQSVALALLRRYSTSRGDLMPLVFESDEAELSYGLDVSDFVGQLGTERATAVLPALMRAEAKKDDRVRECDVIATVTPGTDGQVSITFELSVLLYDEEESFPLTFLASATAFDIVGAVTA